MTAHSDKCERKNTRRQRFGAKRKKNPFLNRTSGKCISAFNRAECSSQISIISLLASLSSLEIQSSFMRQMRGKITKEGGDLRIVAYEIRFIGKFRAAAAISRDSGKCSYRTFISSLSHHQVRTVYFHAIAVFSVCWNCYGHFSCLVLLRRDFLDYLQAEYG